MIGRFILFIVVWTFSTNTYAEDRSVKSAADYKALDAYIEKALDDWDQPGLGIALVHQGDITYQRGYGVKDRRSNAPVTEDTLFGIASVSKSFAAVTIGMLVADGKLDWDDPVIKHLPDFRMPLQQDTLNVTIRDLLSMRTGIASAEYGHRRASLNRSDHVRRVRYHPQLHKLRNQYMYTTDTYTIAGEIVAKVTGMPWEEYAKKVLWDPLGMNATNGDHKKARRSKNAASPHIHQKGVKTPVKWVYEDYNALPAGGVNSTPHEYARWLILHLNKGKYRNTQIVPAEIIKEITTPHSPMRGQFSKDVLALVVGDGPDGITNSAYAMGWMTYDYKGYNIIRHGGGIDGFKSMVGFIPELDFGIVVFGNADEYYMPMSIFHSIVDWHLGNGLARDWSSAFLKKAKDVRQDKEARTAAVYAARQTNTQPSLPLKNYVGAYQDNGAYGNMNVTLGASGLELSSGRMRWYLNHWHHDVFKATPDWPYQMENKDQFIVFSINERGQPGRFTMTGAWTSFERQDSLN
ncbi:MAG: serine hydrolase [Pseudomonadota bacterium]